ncbi:MAG TPA: 6-carboxytetrahydropterin synthase [Bacteroidota bacterium]|nr:6-carboxytetrahydropterin synthase [Bacteroidota bacterium]
MIYLTRKETFCASHRLFNPKFSDEENIRIFGKCAYPNGHGHNYEIYITVAGDPDPETGMIIDLKKLSDLVKLEITDRVDHRHLNFDIDFLKGINPTAENLAKAFWAILAGKISAGKLYSVRVSETENNSAEYRG